MEWIDINKQLPEFDKAVIVTVDGLSIIGFFERIDRKGNYFNLNQGHVITLNENINYEISHWMELPDPPIK